MDKVLRHEDSRHNSVFAAYVERFPNMYLHIFRVVYFLRVVKEVGNTQYSFDDHLGNTEK